MQLSYIHYQATPTSCTHKNNPCLVETVAREIKNILLNSPELKTANFQLSCVHVHINIHSIVQEEFSIAGLDNQRRMTESACALPESSHHTFTFISHIVYTYTHTCTYSYIYTLGIYTWDQHLVGAYVALCYTHSAHCCWLLVRPFLYRLALGVWSRAEYCNCANPCPRDSHQVT